MPYTIVQHDRENGHEWVVASATCHMEDADDALLRSVVDLVRRSYGEEEILADAADLLGTEIAEGTFQTEHLVAAIRAGLPDPTAEGNKPPHLTTYRSQTAEMVAKAALAVAYRFEYPAAPQEGAANPNQPILGFDGWGIARQENGAFVLVFVQVKGTDHENCPPPDAAALANECRRVPVNTSALCRAMSLLARLLRGDPLQQVILRVLEGLGRGELPAMHVAPAIVRGATNGQIADIQPVRDAAEHFAPATARGVVVSIGVSLTDFGRVVMTRARQAA
jgi:hypothetical protein